MFTAYPIRPYPKFARPCTTHLSYRYICCRDILATLAKYIYTKEAILKARGAILLIAASILLPTAVYFYHMAITLKHTALSSLNADWGSFGSYLGGILSPLFTLASIFFIYYSMKENNKNHKTEMDFLAAQQTFSTVQAISSALNKKLATPYNFNQPAVLDAIIPIYDETAAQSSSLQDWLSGKSSVSPAEILESYSYFSHHDKPFHWQYINFVTTTTFDVVATLELALEYCANIAEPSLRKDAVALFNATVSDLTLTTIFHSLSDRVGYSFAAEQDLLDLENIFMHASLLADVSKNFKISGTPFFKKLLLHCLSNLDRDAKAIFNINDNHDAQLIHRDSQLAINSSILYANCETLIGTVKFNLYQILRPMPLFAPTLLADYDAKNELFIVTVTPSEIVCIAAEQGLELPVKYTLHFSLHETSFNLTRLELFLVDDLCQAT